MNLHVPHPHPIARATGRSYAGHRLHIGRPTDGLGYVARCSCRHWGHWFLDRRVAVMAFRQVHLGLPTTAAA